MINTKKTIHLIAYKNSSNIGDNFQTLITKNILEKLGYKISYVDRDKKDTNKNKVIFINGYYSPTTIENINVEFSDNTKAIFYNIHIAGDNGRIKYLKEHFFTNKNIYNSFKRFEPIGCRDEATKNILNSFGIKAKNNECITLLGEKRTKEQEINAKKIIYVDVDEFIRVPKKITGEREYRSQMVPNGEKLTNKEKLNMSKEILEYYKNNAKLIVTSRFHCAMPCIAMGIPVIFFGDKKSKRCEGLKKYINYYDYIHFGFKNITHMKKLSWSDQIPLLSKKIKYDFNIIDVIYNILYKIYLHTIYTLKIIKIDWDIKMPNIENQKKKTIKNIQQQLETIDVSYFV